MTDATPRHPRPADDETPAPDAWEQAQMAVPDEEQGHQEAVSSDLEAPEADAVEQSFTVPLDDERDME